MIKEVTMLFRAPTKTTTEIRVAWNIGEQSGNGLWFPSANKPSLQSFVDDGNSKYGVGTHWLDEQPT